MKSFKLLAIPLFLVLGYFILVSYPYFFSKISHFNSLGIMSLVEEKSDFINKNGRAGKPLLAGEKITGEIKASENNFGVLLFRFVQLSGNPTDTVVFKIKEKGKKDWYYEKNYETNQFQPDQYFTFGFPPFKDSKNDTYVFEIESLSGKYKNATGMSLKAPQVALVYKYTRGDLRSFDVLSSFIFKKFVYVIENADFLKDWQILLTFILPLILILIIQSGKVTVTSVIKFFPTLKKKKNLKILRQIVKFYLLQEKRMMILIKKASLRFSSTAFYLGFLNTVVKKRLAIALVIFLLAFLYRFAASTVDQSNLYPFHSSLGNGVGINSFYSLLGNGGDYDQFIRAATCALKFCPAILGQNFLFESSILGIFYELFGFTGGLNAYLYLMIFVSSIVATLPYILLSRKNWITPGGIIGSLFLATSDYLTHMALNLPPDNGSLFIFSIFYIVYLLTMQYGTIRWLMFFGLLGAIDGLNKLIMLINDLVVLILFVPVFLYDKTKKITQFPFINIRPKFIFYSLLPFLVFLAIYSAWEYIVQIKFSTPYYLRGLIEGNIYASSTDAGAMSIKEIFSRGILETVSYYIGLTIVMQKRIIDYAGLNTILLAPIFIGLLFLTLQKPKFDNFRVRKFYVMKLLFVVLFLAFIFVLLVLFKNNYLGVQEVGISVYEWPNSHYTNVFLFSGILFLFFFNFKYSALRFIIPILPYYFILILLTKNAPWGRLWAHVIVWSVILLCFLIDWILSNAKRHKALKRYRLGAIILVTFIIFYMIPKISVIAGQLRTGIMNSRGEVRYLRWVNTAIPENAIILGGGKSDLVTVAENIHRPIIYNTRWTGAMLIDSGKKVVSNDFSIVNHLKSEENFKKNKYFILEDDISIWRLRVKGVGDTLFSTSSANLLNTGDYTIEVYKFNSDFKKGIYKLKLVRF